MSSRGRSGHRCRFVSVDDTWIWDSPELIHEAKRTSPGTGEGFRAVALLRVIDGMTLDVVSGRLRAGSHSVERVVSYRVRGGWLVEVNQRAIDRMRPHRH